MAKIVAAANSTTSLYECTVGWVKFILSSVFTAEIYTIHYFAKRISNFQDENRAQESKTAETDFVLQGKTRLAETNDTLTQYITTFENDKQPDSPTLNKDGDVTVDLGVAGS